MKRIFATGLAAFCAVAGATERRELAAVPISALISETQQSDQRGAGVALVWWIPVEFWQVTMLQSQNQAAADQLGKAFGDYVVVGVAEGTAKAIGFDFATRDAVLSRLKVQADGVEFQPVDKPNKDAQLFVDMMKPMLASMLGELGSQFHLVILSSGKRRPPSGYDATKVEITLAGSNDSPSRAFEFAGPLDALYVPRLCPNGKPAHITWKFCPWDGTRLPE